MSEHASNSEYEPLEMSAVTRYYNDLKYMHGRYANVIDAVDNLIENSPVPLDTSIDKLMTNEYKNIEWQLEYDPRIAKERLALLPLVIAADTIDNSDIDIDKVQRWYRDTFAGISFTTKDDHPSSCFDVEEIGHHHQMCQISTDCPRIFMKQYLVTELTEPIFSQGGYAGDSRRMYEIMRTKTQVGVKYEFLEQDYANVLFKDYTAKYNDYLTKRQYRIPGTVQ